MNEVSKRESNIELLRIVCMLLIIAHHCVVHGGALALEGTINKYIALFFLPGGKICFVAFVVISTWFLVDKKFKWEHFVKTWFQVLFYSVTFTAFACALGVHVTGRQWISVFFPVAGNVHGFAATYLAFYLLIPFLTILANNVDEYSLKKLVGLLIYYEVISKILGIIFNYHSSLLSSELTLFVMIYFISLYIKRYKSELFQNKSCLLKCLIVIWLGVVTIWYLNMFFSDRLWCQILTGLAQDETSLLYIISGYILFFLFKNISIPQSSVINRLAHASFGVLLFHDHNFFRAVLWREMDSDNYIQSDMFIIWMILCVVSIYLLGFIVDEVRGKLMYLIKIPNRFSDK